MFQGNWLGFTVVTANSSLYVGKDLLFAVDGADVTLGTSVTGNLIFDSNATISNYRPERMVITNNSIQSHMVKQSASGGFIFLVGISDGNYTPAQITGSGNYHVSVQDYASSISNETLLQGGPQRTWHVYTNLAARQLLFNTTPQMINYLLARLVFILQLKIQRTINLT